MSSISSLGIGSGLDLSGLLDQLREAEKGRLEPINQLKSVQEAKLSAYGTLRGDLSAFQAAVDKLNSRDLFASVSSQVTAGSSVSAAADSDAVPGRYDVSVTTLARAQSIATDGFAEGEIFSAGTLSIQAGSGDPIEVDVEEDASLEDIRDAINEQAGGVTASIVNDGDPDNPYRLVLSSDETGTDAAIQSIAFSGGDARLSYEVEPEGGYADGYSGLRQTVEAKDAALTVNGIPITSQSNRVEGAIQGVLLDLTEESDSTVVVERNNFELREAVTDFVDSYNALKETMGGFTSFNAETGEAGELLGDRALRTIDARLRNALGSSEGGEGALSNLSDIGITMQLDGTLELDQEQLDDVLINQRDALTDFFAGESQETGMAGALSQALSAMMDDSGALGSAESSAESQISSLDSRAEQMQRASDFVIERYRQQFTQLDSMIAQMNQTSTYLTQQFDMLASIAPGANKD